MTALAGFWSFGGSHSTTQLFQQLLQSQQIHAPDPPIIKSTEFLTIGRRLFRLLPEDRHDRGPLEGEGRHLLVVQSRVAPGFPRVPSQMRQYRLALLRGAGSGRFARWASGSNS